MSRFNFEDFKKLIKNKFFKNIGEIFSKINIAVLIIYSIFLIII
jgi:hypothetical protein